MVRKREPHSVATDRMAHEFEFLCFIPITQGLLSDVALHLNRGRGGTEIFFGSLSLISLPQQRGAFHIPFAKSKI